VKGSANYSLVTLQLGYVMWPVVPQTGNVSLPSLDKDARLSSRLLGVNVAGAWDDSWSRLCFVGLCFAAKPSDMRG
jgi:hypothetical protein